MKLSLDPRVSDYAVHNALSDHAKQINGISEGRIAAVTNKASALPTTGRYAQGDFIRNDTPVEVGSALSKYVIFGWICVAAGEPGTWVQCRYLTGN